MSLRPCSAILDSLEAGYGVSDFLADLQAGLVVAMVALPLSMALAIASGVPPQNGLYTAIVAGAIVAFLGGSRFQVTGPTAAFVVILAPIAVRFGLAGLLIAGIIAGVLLCLMGLFRMGQLIQFIPYPVTTGFTAGIALVIATIQLKDFLGMTITSSPENYLDRWVTLWHAHNTIQLPTVVIAVVALLIFTYWPMKWARFVPGPLVGLIVAAVLARYAIPLLFHGKELATIATTFQYDMGHGVMGYGIPRTPPSFTWPWQLPGPGGKPFVLTFDTIRQLLPPAFAIAMLGAIESLLSAVVADGMTRTRHNPDAELLALGTGNIVCPFFGGIAATGAIARTATGIRAGSRSPFASILHATFIFVAILVAAPLLGYLPMAALAALLIRVAWNMSETRHFIHILRVGPRSDVAVLLSCFSLTVLFDMVIGVSVGILLASLLFMQRMASLTRAKLFEEADHPQLDRPLPDDVLLYEIGGPLFFGATQRAIDTILHGSSGKEVRAVIFEMSNIPSIDVTGLVGLENAVRDLTKRNIHVFLVDLAPQPFELLSKAGLLNDHSHIFVAPTIQMAMHLLDAVD
jgi:SulP family sulfate permease